MSTDKIDIKDFSNDHTTRGIWHSLHRTAFKAQDRSDVVVIYAFTLMFVKDMICKVCNTHAKQFISETGYIVDILQDQNITDSEVIDAFNKWLYEFHKTANKHANKTSPSYEDVAEFYLQLEVCLEGCGH